MAHFGAPVWESGAHCWLAGWPLAGWLAMGTPGSEAIWSGDGNGVLSGGLVALNTVHGTRYKVQGTKVQGFQAIKASRLCGYQADASQPGGPHKGGRRISLGSLCRSEVIRCTLTGYFVPGRVDMGFG